MRCSRAHNRQGKIRECMSPFREIPREQRILYAIYKLLSRKRKKVSVKCTCLDRRFMGQARRGDISREARDADTECQVILVSRFARKAPFTSLGSKAPAMRLEKCFFEITVLYQAEVQICKNRFSKLK